jgi:phage/plasmid-associated DNA primase
MIDGALAWQTNGLPKPQVLAEATDEYFAAQDAFGMWLAKRCITVPHLQERPAALLNDYNDWAETNGEESANRSRFRGWAKKQPGLKYKRVKGCDYLAGIGRRPLRPLMPIRPERRALYPADWKAISLRVRKAAGWRCEWRPAEQGKPNPSPVAAWC